jgi:site-specific DNA-methyltransferase (adenine-specific)
LLSLVERESLIRVGVWVKNDPAPQFTGDRPGTGWESLLIMHPSGKKRWNGGGRPAVWRTNICKNGNEHPAQKPVELMAALVSDFTDAKESVLDPYMGSGTTGVACMNLGRYFIGIEREPKYFDIACRRMQKAYDQPDMFIAPPEPKPVQGVLIP